MPVPIELPLHGLPRHRVVEPALTIHHYPLLFALLINKHFVERRYLLITLFFLRLKQLSRGNATAIAVLRARILIIASERV